MIVPAEGQFRLDREADTERLGAAIARELKRREAVCLSGPLGAGKSSLARALIRALTGEATEAPSPTFTLVQTYETKTFPLAHFDLYRIERPQELEELGLEDALEDGAAVIEWPERLGDRLPADRLDIRLEIEGEGRRARLDGHGRWSGRSIGL
jgi:tRNA threonylcarbamoyladenosine biosynthesis protein TsaE